MRTRNVRDPLVDERIDDGPDASDVRAAYERGRKDERSSRKRHPLMVTLTVLVAIAGAAVLAVAAREGSFARGGAVVDQNLSAAADRAEPVVRDATVDAGHAIKQAGETVREKASDAVN